MIMSLLWSLVAGAVVGVSFLIFLGVMSVLLHFMENIRK